MTKTRSTTYLTIGIILLCSLYWLHRASGDSNIINTTQFAVTDVPVVRPRDARLKGTLSSFGQGQHHMTGDQAVQAESATTVSASDLHDQSQNQPPVSDKVLPEGYPAAFPREIWQTSSQAGKDKYGPQMQTWENVRGYSHHWLSDADADDFVREAFSITKPSVVAFWNELSAGIQSNTSRSHVTTSSPANSSDIVVDSTSAIVLRADVLRYLLMYVRGGVYADIDTSVLLHIDQWIPASLGSQVINAIIGIEYDDHTYQMFVRPISFCQWALMSKPNHPIFERAVNRVISNLEFLARRQRVQNLSQLKLDKLDVLEATGPGMISDVVLEVIRDQLPDQQISWASFHDQKEAKVYGDVLILPINGFAGNQKHSHAGSSDYGVKLVQHHFARSWYQPKAKPAA